MNYKDLLKSIEKYKELSIRLSNIEAGRADLLKNAQNQAERQFGSLGNNISSFCGGSAFRSVIKGYCELYGSVISVVNGYIAYRGKVMPPKAFGFENAQSVALGCVSEIKASMEGISKKLGDIDAHARRLSQAFATLRAIFAKINTLKGEAIESELSKERAKEQEIKKEMDALLVACPALSDIEKAEEALADLKGSLSKEIARFKFEDIPMKEGYGEQIRIPIAIKDNEGEICYWSPLNDGVLCLSIGEKDTLCASYDFVKATIMQFLYAYPNMDKQIFYCCNHASSAMDIFLETLGDKENGVGVSIFYRDTQQLNSFNAQVGEYIGYLRDEIRERLKQLDYSDKSDVFEYNQENGSTVQKPILVILHGYPNGFGGCENLDYIFEAGKRVGIFCLVVKDEQKKERNTYYDTPTVMPEEFGSINCQLSGEGFFVNGEGCQPVRISDEKRRALIKTMRNVKKSSQKSYVSYEDIGFGTYQPKKSYSRISIPVAIAGKNVYNVNLVCNNDEGGNYPTGYFVLGNQNAGKSSLIDAMIINGSMAYSPDELNFYLLDFKDGVSANAYTGENAIPHVRVIAQENKEEDAQIILSNLLKEMERRNKIFKARGKNIQSIANYNKIAEKSMPAIIVIIDECQSLFKNEKLIESCTTLIRKGRSTGIYLILATQLIESGMTSSLGLIKGRACFESTKEKAERIIDASNARRVPTEIKAGTGYAFISSDLGVSSEKVRVAWHNAQIGEYNRMIREKWMPLGYQINLTVAGENSPLYIGEACKEQNKLSMEEKLNIPYGENYFDHTSETFDFRDDEEKGATNHTILALGQNERTNTAILTSVMVGALRSKAKIKLIDESKDGQISAIFGSHPLVERKAKGEYLETLKDAYNEFLRRSENHKESYEPYFLVLHGLNHITAYDKNEALSQGGTSPQLGTGGRIDLNALRRGAGSSTEQILGKDTLLKMITGIENAPSMYIVISGTRTIVENSSDRKAYKGCDYKVLQSSVGEDIARNILEDSFNNKMMEGINENMLFVSCEHSRYVKVRHYIYDFSKKEVKEIILNAVKGEKNEN